MTTAPPSDDRADLRKVAALVADAVGPTPGRFAVIVALAVAAALLESASLILLALLLGGGTALGGVLLAPLAALGPAVLAGLYLGAVAVAVAATYAQALAAEDLTRRFGERLRLRLHAHVLDAAWGSPALARPADVLHALTAEAGQSAVAVQLAIGIAARLLTLPALAAAALTLSPGLTVAAAGLAALLGLPSLHLARRAYRAAAGAAGEQRALAADLADDLAGLKSLKLMRAEPVRRQALADRLAVLGALNTAMAGAAAAVRGWQRLATAVAVAAGAGYGLLVLDLDGARMVALALAVVRLATGSTHVLDQGRTLARLLPAYEAVRRREADCAAAREPAAATVAPVLARALAFHGVGYTHPGSDRATLAGIDLDVPAGRITALVGPSGAGKSTIADLAMGLIAPTEGRITIDGRPLDAAARVAWRARVAYVPQDGFLFHDTIRANLMLAAPGADAAAIDRALEAAAAGFVHKLPAGLDTIVGHRGGRLSGGERQRVMLARALLQDPDLLVLDEATAALDPDTEAAVLAALGRRRAGCTVLLIAHRPTAIAAADRVLRVADGRIAPAAAPPDRA